MINKHIALVKKWLANPKSVTQEELLANKNASFDAVDAAVDDAYAANVDAAYYAAYAANDACYGACGAAYWVKQYEELTKSTCNMKKPIKSDGGSSSYYTLVINDQAVQTEDIIRDVFGNDFDYGNVFKSLVRAYQLKKGAGKEGSSIEYEINKIRYSCNKIKRESFKNE